VPTPPSTPNPPHGKEAFWDRRRAVKLAASLSLGAACVWLMHVGALRLVPDRAALSAVDFWLVALYPVLHLACTLVRAGRWQLLLWPVAKVPFTTVVRVALVGFAALWVLPLRTGEAVRPLMIRRAGISGWAATGTVGAERVIDALFLSLVLLVALGLSHPLDPLPDRIGELAVSPALVPRAAYAALGIFGAAFALMALFYWWRDLARRLVRATLGVVSIPLADYVAKRVEEVASGLDFLADARFSLPYLGATSLYHFGTAGSFLVLGHACGLSHLTFTEACVIVGVLAVGIVLPGAPGYFGAFQLSLYAGLSLYAPPAEVMGPGSAFVFLLYLCHVGVTLAAGAVAVWLEPTTPASLAPPAASRGSSRRRPR
jgi:hypothetical protein